MERPAVQTLPQFVCKVSVSRLAVIGSSAPPGALISVAYVAGTDPPVKKSQAPWSMPGKHTNPRCQTFAAFVLQSFSYLSLSSNYLCFRPGYQDVVTIPAGATLVDIKQRAPGNGRQDNSYLAVRRQDGIYLLNGDYKLMTMETDISVQGSLLRYSGSSAVLERLRSFSPLPEPLTIQVLSVGEAPRPRVKYSYFAPRPNTAAATPNNGGRRQSINAIREVGGAEWTLRDWGLCSQSCGGGMQQREVVCLDSQGHSSRDCPEELRPLVSRSCNSQPCPSWLLGEWSECSKTCGRGFRKRQLRCIGHGGQTLTHDSCDTKNRPRPLLEMCNRNAC